MLFRSRVIEIYGPESSGKTTLALSAVGQAQKAGGVAAFIDAEHALDAEYAQKLGVNIDDDSRRAMQMVEELGVSFPVLFDERKEVSKLYKVEAMPVTVLVDRDGKVRHVHHGYKPGYEEKYLTEIRSLLRE